MWPPLRMFHLEVCGEIYHEETRVMGLFSSEEHDRSSSYFDTIPEVWVRNQGQNFGTNNYEGSRLFAVDYKLYFLGFCNVTYIKTRLYKLYCSWTVNLEEKLTGCKNAEDNSNVAQHAKVSKNVLVSAHQRLGPGLVSDSKSNVSVSVSISGKVGRSRLELEVKHLGLVLDLNVSFTSLSWFTLVVLLDTVECRPCCRDRNPGPFRPIQSRNPGIVMA